MLLSTNTISTKKIMLKIDFKKNYYNFILLSRSDYVIFKKAHSNKL